MRLGFYYHTPAITKNNRIYMPGPTARFLDSLAVHCEQIICFLHSANPDEVVSLDYPLGAANISLVDIGPHDSVPERTLFARRYTRHIHDHRDLLDIVLLRGPSPLLPAMAAAARPLPVAILLVGDYLTGINDLPQPGWRKEAIRLWAFWNKWRQQQVARHSLTFVNSHVLYDELAGKIPYLMEMKTTTLNVSDFHLREDTCQCTPIRLLYVGRMDRTKGLLQMVEAVAHLVAQGEDVVLDLVGWPEPNDPVIEELEKSARTKDVECRVRYRGGKPLGPELFECYKQADIFVIASSFEGFPRTIWEAMAHSLPVVATRVGSIPAYIEGAAELIQPHSPSELAQAIATLIHDPDRRKMLIRKGRTLAEENTLEHRSQDLIAALNGYIA